LATTPYLIASGGEAAIIDPQRDAGRFLAAAEARASSSATSGDPRHNDYVSGRSKSRGDRARSRRGEGRYAFPIRPLMEGDEIKVGDLRIVAIETAGTHARAPLLPVYEGGAKDPAAAFTGGSLMVATAGRTTSSDPTRPMH